MLVGCDEDRTYNARDSRERPSSVSRAVKFTFEDHDYIVFGYVTEASGTVHDPECRKCKKKVEE